MRQALLMRILLLKDQGLSDSTSLTSVEELGKSQRL